MKSAFNLLHDLLPFSQPGAGRKAAEVRGLLDTMVGLSPYEVVNELTARIIPAIVRQQNLHMRVNLLENARQEAEMALPVLEPLVDHAELPLSMAAATQAIAADNLMKALANAYFGVTRAMLQGNQYKTDYQRAILISIFNEFIDFELVYSGNFIKNFQDGIFPLQSEVVLLSEKQFGKEIFEIIDELQNINLN